MNVTIVAKTRMGGGACIGGIAADGRSVRLIASDMAFNDHFNQEYQVGQVWEIDADPPDRLIPPHVENVIVRRKRLVGHAGDLAGLIERHMPIHIGGPETLYDGLLQTAPSGALYVTERTGIPPCSTMFWRPDRSLTRNTAGKRIRYHYPAADGEHTLVFVGYQEPAARIPAGALLRVSLAHWWRPEEHPEEELRCYVQLSGWVEEGESTDFTDYTDYQNVSLEDSAQSVEAVQSVKSVDSSSLDEARAVLKRVFGYDEFRPLQEAIIGNVLAGRDSLAVMPTGSGKSMCYQLPALLFPGLTVVVSPLISLMEDQVTQLRETGVAAAYLNSTLAYDEYVAISHRVAAGHVKLLYTAPETLLRPETLVMLEQCRVDCLTIDEAHCISEWGHDFRPEYRQLAEVRRRLPGAVCLAVTATATERVRRDIRTSLGIPGAAEFVSSFDRENLLLAAEARTSGLGQIIDFLEAHRGESGIIYCVTKKQVDKLAEQLNAHGWNALPYHAGLDTATRQTNQRRFTYDEAPIIVATVAFGMGINKSNVRFVVHYDLPKDVESYYQQIGRAGRDGLQADCLLLYSQQDVMTINFILDQGDAAQRPGAAARLQAMLAYAESNECRRRPLLAYFGETYARDRCGLCDNCRTDERELADLTLPAQKFLSCVRRTGEVFGAGHVIDVLRGSHAKGVLSRGHDRLSTYNIGGEYSRAQWQQLARQFVQKGLLAQDMEYGGLKLTAAGWGVLRGEPFHGAPPLADRRPLRAATAAPSDYDADLFELLRARRQELARAAGLPPYVIFHDTSLIDMAAHYPQSPEVLSQMQGVGAAKLERYGAAMLEVIRAYCRERGIAEKPKRAVLDLTGASVAATLAPVRSGSATNRREEVLDLYRRGRGAAEIADIYGVKTQTIINHLWEAVQAGETLEAERLLAESRLPAEEQRRVLAAFAELGADRLRPIYDAMGEGVEWEELHLLRLYYVVSRLESAPGDSPA